MKNVLVTVVWPVIAGIVQSILQSLAQAAYDSFRSTLIEAVAEAEKKFRDGDYSEKKKEEVIKSVLDYIQRHKKLSGVQIWALRTFISRVIDKMIDDLNKNYGHSWSEYVSDFLNYWAKRLPLID